VLRVVALVQPCGSGSQVAAVVGRERSCRKPMAPPSCRVAWRSPGRGWGCTLWLYKRGSGRNQCHFGGSTECAYAIETNGGSGVPQKMKVRGLDPREPSRGTAGAGVRPEATVISPTAPGIYAAHCTSRPQNRRRRRAGWVASGFLQEIAKAFQVLPSAEPHDPKASCREGADLSDAE